jgi:phosphoribosylamine--glycine ligase
MDFDLLKLCQATIQNKLSSFKFKWKKDFCINVVLTSKGYPEAFKKGYEINIKDKPLLFYAGVNNQNGRLQTNGGRVLSVVALEKTLSKTRTKVYKEIQKVNFENMHYRKDIGL